LKSSDQDVAGHFERLIIAFRQQPARCRKLMGVTDVPDGELTLTYSVSGNGPPGWQSDILKWLLDAAGRAINRPGKNVGPASVPAGIEVSAKFVPGLDVRDKPLDISSEPEGNKEEPSDGKGPMEEGESKSQKDDPLPYKDLESATIALKAAIEEAVAAASNKRDIGALCDEYTKAARSFAAIILGERIRQSFESKIDPESGRPTETYKEKIAHAGAIRDWLHAWNFGFKDPKSDLSYQLRASSSSGALGRFRLGPHGTPSNSAQPSSWEEVARVVLKPVLCDVTAAVWERDPHRRGK
jgi:hypothetical protein